MARGGKTDVETGIRSKSRQLPSDLRLIRRKFQKLGKQTRRDLKRSFAGVRRDMIGALGIGFGTAAFVQAGREAHEFNKQLLDVRVQAGMSRVAAAKLERAMDGIAVATGRSRKSILEGTEALVNKLGATWATEEAIRTLAMTEVAATTPMKDLVGVQQLFIKNFGIIKDIDIRNAFSSLLSVGKEASVPLNEMSNNLINTSAAIVDFGLKGRRGVATLGAMFQAMQPFLGGPEETATGINSLAKALNQSAVKMRKGLKIDVYKPGSKSKIRDPVAIGRDLRASGVLNDAQKFRAMFPGIREQRAVKALIRSVDEFAKWRDKALSADDMPEDFATKINSEVGRINIALVKIDQTITSIFTAKRMDAFVSAVELGANAVKSIVDNLQLAVGLLVAFKTRALWIKGLSLAGQFAAPAGAAFTGQAAAAAAARATASVGQLAVAAAGATAGLAAAGAAGFALGTWLDNELGISDWLSNTNNTRKKKRRGFSSTGRELYGDILDAGKRLDTDAPASARRGRLPNMILRRAREEGFLRDDNSLNMKEITRVGNRDRSEIVATIQVALDSGLLLRKQERKTRASAQ